MRLFVLLLPLLLLLSCTPKKPSGAVVESQDQAADAADSPAPALTLVRTEESAREETDKTAEKEVKETWDEFSGPLFLQRIKPHSYILSDSLIVGFQADPLSMQLSEREADYLVREFLNSYRKGRVRSELFTENAHPLFLEEVEKYKDLGARIREFYPGTFRQSGNRSMVRVALLSDTGYIRGVIHMQVENGIWGIQDWEMPLGNWPGDPLPVEGDELIVPGSL